MCALNEGMDSFGQSGCLLAVLLPCCPLGSCLPAVQWEQRHFGKLIPLPLSSLEKFCLPLAAFPGGRRWHYEHYTGEAFLLVSVHCSRTELSPPCHGSELWGSPAYTGREQERTHFHTVGQTEHPLAPHQNKCGVRRVNTHSNKLLLLRAPEVSCDLTHATPHSSRRLSIPPGAWGHEGYRSFPSLPTPSSSSHHRR